MTKEHPKKYIIGIGLLEPFFPDVEVIANNDPPRHYFSFSPPNKTSAEQTVEAFLRQLRGINIEGDNTTISESGKILIPVELFERTDVIERFSLGSWPDQFEGQLETAKIRTLLPSSTNIDRTEHYGISPHAASLAYNSGTKMTPPDETKKALEQATGIAWHHRSDPGTFYITNVPLRDPTNAGKKLFECLDAPSHLKYSKDGHLHVSATAICEGNLANLLQASDALKEAFTPARHSRGQNTQWH